MCCFGCRRVFDSPACGRRGHFAGVCVAPRRSVAGGHCARGSCDSECRGSDLVDSRAAMRCPQQGLLFCGIPLHAHGAPVASSPASASPLAWPSITMMLQVLQDLSDVSRDLANPVDKVRPRKRALLGGDAHRIWTGARGGCAAFAFDCGYTHASRHSGGPVACGRGQFATQISCTRW
jgi:hypothetical protein